MLLEEAKDLVLDLLGRQGFIYEDDYQEISDEMDPVDHYKFNDWLMTANIPMRRVRMEPSDYRKKIKKQVKNPNIRNLMKKKKAAKRIEIEFRAKIDVRGNKDILDDPYKFIDDFEGTIIEGPLQGCKTKITNVDEEYFGIFEVYGVLEADKDVFESELGFDVDEYAIADILINDAIIDFIYDIWGDINGIEISVLKSKGLEN